VVRLHAIEAIAPYLEEEGEFLKVSEIIGRELRNFATVMNQRIAEAIARCMVHLGGWGANVLNLNTIVKELKPLDDLFALAIEYCPETLHTEVCRLWHKSEKSFREAGSVLAKVRRLMQDNVKAARLQKDLGKDQYEGAPLGVPRDCWRFNVWYIHAKYRILVMIRQETGADGRLVQTVLVVKEGEVAPKRYGDAGGKYPNNKLQLRAPRGVIGGWRVVPDHRLICELFSEIPVDNMVVNHIGWTSGGVLPWMLEYCTQQRNVMYGGEGANWITEKDWEWGHRNTLWIVSCLQGQLSIVDLAYDLDIGEFYERLIGGGFMRWVQWTRVGSSWYIMVRTDFGGQERVNLDAFVAEDPKTFWALDAKLKRKRTPRPR
jgi:hypothetical protein